MLFRSRKHAKKAAHKKNAAVPKAKVIVPKDRAGKSGAPIVASPVPTTAVQQTTVTPTTAAKIEAEKS